MKPGPKQLCPTKPHRNDSYVKVPGKYCGGSTEIPCLGLDEPSSTMAKPPDSLLVVDAPAALTALVAATGRKSQLHLAEECCQPGSSLRNIEAPLADRSEGATP